MALDGSYDGLKASVADFLNRGDLASAIPDFIALAEAQMTRRLAGRLRQGLPVPRRMIARADTTIAPGTEYVAAPADFHGPIEFVLDGRLVLDYLDSTNLAQKKQRGEAGAAPRWYALVGGELQLFPAADQSHAGELTYIARVPALSQARPINWILADYPDAYLYGALVQSAPYLKDDGRAAVWGTLFSAALEDICHADPMPGDKSMLRSEAARLSGCSAYDIATNI